MSRGEGGFQPLLNWMREGLPAGQCSPSFPQLCPTLANSRALRKSQESQEVGRRLQQAHLSPGSPGHANQDPRKWPSSLPRPSDTRGRERLAELQLFPTRPHARASETRAGWTPQLSRCSRCSHPEACLRTGRGAGTPRVQPSGQVAPARWGGGAGGAGPAGRGRAGGTGGGGAGPRRAPPLRDAEGAPAARTRASFAYGPRAGARRGS